MTIIYRSVKGSNLTAAEVDGNFTDLDGRTTTLEGLPLGVGIASIDVTGNQMTITLTDASVQGPFTLPMWDLVDLLRGDWQPLTPYLTNEIVRADGNLYAVATDHTSEATFDAGAFDTAGNFYALLMDNPGIAGKEVTAATYTTVIEDASHYLRFTNATGCVITIDETITYPAWTEIHFRDECDSGGITVDIATPGSINGVTGYLNQSAAKGATVGIKQVAATGAWDIFGLLATETT